MVEIAQRKLVRVLESGTDPEQVAVSADGRQLFVANEDAALMSVVDPTSGKVLRTFKVGEEPEGVSVHPRNGHVYVTSEDAGAVFAEFTDVGQGWVIEDAFGQHDPEPPPRLQEGQAAFDEQDFRFHLAEFGPIAAALGQLE